MSEVADAFRRPSVLIESTKRDLQICEVPNVWMSGYALLIYKLFF